MKLKNNSSPIDSSIFESFNKLTSDDEKVRIKGASGLIKSLEETSEDKVNRIIKKCALHSSKLMFNSFRFSYKNSLIMQSNVWFAVMDHQHQVRGLDSTQL